MGAMSGIIFVYFNYKSNLHYLVLTLLTHSFTDAAECDVIFSKQLPLNYCIKYMQYGKYMIYCVEKSVSQRTL